MPVVESNLNTVGQGIDANAFLLLLANPQKYQAALDQFLAAQTQANAVIETANERLRQVCAIDEIAALLDQTRVDRELAAKVLEDAQNQAQVLLSRAKEEALAIGRESELLLEESRSTARSLEEAARQKGSEADERLRQVGVKEAGLHAEHEELRYARSQLTLERERFTIECEKQTQFVDDVRKAGNELMRVLR